ncbi:hypothetical protein TrRE_jg219, partial [Triparma retinervis]
VMGELCRRSVVPSDSKKGGGIMGAFNSMPGATPDMSEEQALRAVRDLVELEKAVMAREDLYENAEAVVQNNPDLFVNRVVLHFRYLFGIRSMEGVFPKMNEVYLFTTEMNAFMRELRGIFGIKKSLPSASVTKMMLERLAQSPPKSQLVMDLGTGPYAVLAIQAAKAGAKKVYAVEAIKQAADLAKSAVAKAVRKGEVSEGVIEVIEGLSTKVNLPEKVDLVVAEIIGSIASEEGLHATLRDVHSRHVKDPLSPSSFIPTRVQTLFAPASYTLHYALGPPEYDWGKLVEPVRFNCRDPAVQIMSDPKKSHWQTVVAIASERPVEVSEGDVVGVEFTEVLGGEVDSPTRYEVRGGVERA